MSTVDVSELTAYAAELREAGRMVAREMRGIGSKAGLNIKRQAIASLRAQQSGKGHKGKSSLWRLPQAISYDLVEQGFGDWELEVGPDQTKSGLGVGVELGSRHHAPMPFLGPAFDAEVAKTEEAAEKLLLRALFREA